MIFRNLTTVELLRYVDATGADSDRLVAALADALRRCDPEMVEQLEEKVAQLGRDAEAAQERGWGDALTVARELVEVELHANIEANGRQCINPGDPVDAVLDRLDYEFDLADRTGSDDYVPPDSLRARTVPAGRPNSPVSAKTRRPNANGAAPHSEKPTEPKMAGAGKHQRRLVAFLREVGSATRQDVRTHLTREGGVSETGAYGVLDRAINSGLLERRDGDRVALAHAAVTD